MSKMSIEWHKKSAEASEVHIGNEIEKIRSRIGYVQRSLNELRFKQAQIEEAENSGKGSFDEDLFLKKDKPAFMDFIDERNKIIW